MYITNGRFVIGITFLNPEFLVVRRNGSHDAQWSIYQQVQIETSSWSSFIAATINNNVIPNVLKIPFSHYSLRKGQDRGYYLGAAPSRELVSGRRQNQNLELDQISSWPRLLMQPSPPRRGCANWIPMRTSNTLSFLISCVLLHHRALPNPNDLRQMYLHSTW